MLKLGKGVGRAAVRRALSGRSRPKTFRYEGVLRAREIRDTVAGIRDAGSPEWSLPLLAWLASHPNSPEDVLRDLHRHGGRDVLLSLAMNRNLPPDLRKALLAHEDEEVRDTANHVFARAKRH